MRKNNNDADYENRLIESIKEKALSMIEYKNMNKVISEENSYFKYRNKPMIVAIEGVDGTGKETQVKNLNKYLTDAGLTVKTMSFPNYNDDSSIFVKKYLSGEFGDISNLNSYQSSLFFTVDRLVTYITSIKDIINNKSVDIIIFDRYIGSNWIHQGAKIAINEELSKPNNVFNDLIFKSKLQEFISNMSFLELNMLNLPNPDITIYLDMPNKASKLLRSNRKNKITKESKQDIHESNSEYMSICNYTGKYIANYVGWNTINCAYIEKRFLRKDLVNIKSINEITNEIMLCIFKDYVKISDDVREEIKDEYEVIL